MGLWKNCSNIVRYKLNLDVFLDIQFVVSALDEMKVIAVPGLQKLSYGYWFGNPDPKECFLLKICLHLVSREHIMFIFLNIIQIIGTKKLFIKIICKRTQI